METIPITTRVKYAQSGKKPVNQEVTMKADGTGGPVADRNGLLKQGAKSCGCKTEVESPAKFDPLTMMVARKVANRLL